MSRALDNMQLLCYMDIVDYLDNARHVVLVVMFYVVVLCYLDD